MTLVNAYFEDDLREWGRVFLLSRFPVLLLLSLGASAVAWFGLSISGSSLTQIWQLVPWVFIAPWIGWGGYGLVRNVEDYEYHTSK